jgi:5-formyltetrahydrofolate cyclo-ligase
MTKKELRSAYKAKRQQLTDADIARFDDLLLIQFQKLALPPLHLVHTYLPMEGSREIDTYPFTRYLQFRNPGLQLAIPRTNMTTMQMDNYLYDEHTELVMSSYGIPEPAGGVLVEPQHIDLVLTPLLVFDEAGFRVGYGKGFYDKFLQLCRGDVITVGLSYFDPVKKIEDTGEFDIPLQACVTPQALYEF